MEDLIIKILTFGLEDLSGHNSEIVSLCSGRSSYAHETFSSVEDLNTISEFNQPNFYIFNIKSKSEFVLVTKHLKFLNNNGIIFKSMCFFNFENPKAENILLKNGVSNVFNNKTTTKNFIIKVNMLLRSLTQNIKEAGSNLTFKEMEKRETPLEEKNHNIRKNIGLKGVKRRQRSKFIYKPNEIQVGESSLFNQRRELQNARFYTETSLEDNSELLDYIDSLGEKGFLNLEQGTLDIAPSFGRNIDCCFDGFFEDEITLDIQGHVEVNINDPVSLFVKFVYDKCKVEIELDGKINEIERYETNSRFVTIALDKSCSDQRDYFMSLYEMRQRSINEFMELAKGIA